MIPSIYQLPVVSESAEISIPYLGKKIRKSHTSYFDAVPLKGLPDTDQSHNVDELNNSLFTFMLLREKACQIHLEG